MIFFVFPCDRKRGKQFSSSTSINPLNLFVGAEPLWWDNPLNVSRFISIVFSFNFSTRIVGETIVMAKITFSNLGIHNQGIIDNIIIVVHQLQSNWRWVTTFNLSSIVPGHFTLYPICSGTLLLLMNMFYFWKYLFFFSVIFVLMWREHYPSDILDTV